MELAVIETKEIMNKDLKTSLNKLNKAIVTGIKNQWLVCSELKAIVNKETFKEDFNTLDKFASYIGISTGNLSKLVRVGDYRDFVIQQFELNAENSEGEEAKNLSDDIEALEKKGVSFFMELLPIKEEDLSVALWDIEFNSSLTVAQLRTRVKAYLNTLGTYAPQDALPDSVPENTERMLEDTDSAPKDTDNAPEDTDSAPENTDSAPENTIIKEKVSKVKFDTMSNIALRNTNEGLLYLADGMVLKVKFFIDKNDNLCCNRVSLLDMVHNKEYFK